MKTQFKTESELRKKLYKSIKRGVRVWVSEKRNWVNLVGNTYQRKLHGELK